MDKMTLSISTFAIGLCATVDECDTVLDELLGAFDGGLSDFTVHCCICLEAVSGRGDVM